MEWEQYRDENDRIDAFRTDSIRHIKEMRACDRRVSVQLVEYVNLLKERQAEIDRYRNFVTDSFKNSEMEKGNILKAVVALEADTKRRFEVVDHVQTQLNNLTKKVIFEFIPKPTYNKLI